MPDPLEQVRAAFRDQYDVISEVGRGGMATVYLATDLKHDRQVALKVLRPELTTALGGERFPREIRIVAQLTHPHVLPLHDSGELGGYLYYVLPYVEGHSLRQRLEEGPLPLSDVVRILREVLDALAYAHGRGIVHRDIKPGNVMLSGRHALVTDFGVAKALTQAGAEKLTTVGMALGTPAYMSPEQAMGQTDIDGRSDLYAVGILAYEMLTGQPPFEKPTPQAILSAHVMERPKDPAELRPDVPRELADLVLRCLEKDPADRWQTADELLPRLESLATPSGGLTPTYTRPIEATRLSRPRRRWPLVAGALGGAAAVVVAAVLALAGGASDGIESVAVLPMQDISGTDQAFVEGVHAALITALAQANVVAVVSRSNVMRFQGGGETTREIADALGVQAVVEGTVFRAGDRMRINVQMVDPTSLRQFWSQVYERDVVDVLEVQGEVVGTIALELGQALAAAAGNEGRP